MLTDPAEHLPFDFGTLPSQGDTDFIRSDCNQAACAAVLAQRQWPDGRLLLVGPARSGKTHLAAIWSKRENASVLNASQLAQSGVDDMARGHRLAVLGADQTAGRDKLETALFHLCNTVALTGGKLLLTARRPASQWPLRLPDLNSRMEGCQIAEIGPPDDRLLALLLTKLLADRQISVAPAVVSYILPRMQRTFAAAEALVAEMDRRSLAAGRRISRATAAASLKAAGLTAHTDSHE